MIVLAQASDERWNDSIYKVQASEGMSDTLQGDTPWLDVWPDLIFLFPACHDWLYETIRFHIARVSNK